MPSLAALRLLVNITSANKATEQTTVSHFVFLRSLLDSVGPFILRGVNSRVRRDHEHVLE